MSLVIYRGTHDMILKQLTCFHNWHGPSRDGISRYFKCKNCFCIERDVDRWEEFLRLERQELTNCIIDLC